MWMLAYDMLYLLIRILPLSASHFQHHSLTKNIQRIYDGQRRLGALGREVFLLKAKQIFIYFT